MNLYEEEIRLEEQAIGIGKNRYFNELRPYDLDGKTRTPTSLSETPVGISQMKIHWQKLADKITSWCEDTLAGKPSRGAATVNYINKFDPEVVSFLTIKACINALHTNGGDGMHQTAMTSVAISIADLLVAEDNYESFKDNARGYYEVIWKKIKSSNDNKYKRAVLNNSMRKAGVDIVKLNVNQKVHIGIRLLELFIDVTGLIEVRKIAKGKKQVYVVGPTKNTEKFLENAHEFYSISQPAFMPMVVPPNRWDSPVGGGYLLPWIPEDIRDRSIPNAVKREYCGRLKFIKTDNFHYLEDLKSNPDMDNIYRAVNALQETPWKINTSVLRVLEYMWDTGATVGDMPSAHESEMPAKPHDIDTNEEALKDWKKECNRIREADARLISKRFGIIQKMWLANKFKQYDSIYFPHTLDWRGRAYPVPSLMNPQADDVGKSLIEFANGKPIGEHGGYWLAVHLANSFGYDKCSLDDRVAWVQENEQFILDSAIDPCNGIGYWTQADKPWQFLAACFEWMGFKLNGEDHITHLPIGMDGSCNGLQNFSAMLRDEVGGAAVNLVPSDKPEDIYQLVTDRTKFKLGRLAANGENIAATLMTLVNRKVVKRPVMTKPYAATHDGMRKQMVNELPDTPEYTAWELSKYLTPIVDESIGEIVIASREVMDWLKDTARVVASRQLPVHWTTPLGLPVLQQYKFELTKQIKTHFGGARIDLSVKTDKGKLNKKKQALGIAPNFVHSMDASHMMITTLHCLDNDITDLAMVHDSYAAHACNIDDLNVLLREAFIEQYEDDVLKYFKDKLEGQIPDKLSEKIEELPAYGELDVSQIRGSVYFFS
jgi:DNA-directed RNA polymerase